jgi:hypothetical protein
MRILDLRVPGMIDIGCRALGGGLEVPVRTLPEPHDRWYEAIGWGAWFIRV